MSLIAKWRQRFYIFNYFSANHYTLHLSSCCFVGCFHSPQSHSYLCSWGFVHLPPRCNSKSIGYIHYEIIIMIGNNNNLPILKEVRDTKVFTGSDVDEST
ncbi:conserved hypothetical Protein [Photorhabdus asymbiotica]|uniref:Uncharacterized protein n=2 Tax=Photorhabdus asymbiotica TaxID=291112 RepID=C7BLR7_PHOAA|nr:conserved hypothetical Protein [Photorhabdus asymbiotica]